MGFEGVREIPFLDFSKQSLDLEEGSEEWKALCNKVREACEDYGCFQVAYDGIPVQQHEEMFVAIKELFELPAETKKKNSSTKPYFGYAGKSDDVPLYESLGVEDASRLESAQAFTELMWPDGNPGFCEKLNSMSSKMQELGLLIRKMIFQSLGLEMYYDSHAESSNGLLRLNKYEAPPAGSESAMGLLAHKDKSLITILSQNHVKGLEVLTNDGSWVSVAPSEGSFIVFIGEMLEAWSNGRLLAPKHRVVMSGDIERYSFALFCIPKEGVVIEVPKELVDKEHPLLFRPFKYMDFLRYFQSVVNSNALENENVLGVYAGI
ncbi:PREDICTED: probable 2-oxoglutarate-dependent dioxygenase AOP1 [Nelumbo nucifera]|uniref:2-oxoglutarate-dependent dioxygenase DAO n=1 Tax=Nelumbo nucifera TaxID=4432 RepID=A0A1U7Z8Z8_NELNU|nr:PREDICTED: probable 2-oxoglutarate-dependent dioxygenase AOP1 [Nelumbo nucifera]